MITERFVAIDNVCAWPNLTRMPDGAIVAAIFNQPTHGGWEGDVECWASKDGGRIWQLRGVPAPHEPGTNRMNVAAGCARDGSLLVLASGWSCRNPAGAYSSPHDGEVLPIWTCRSNDGGATWTRSDGPSSPDSSSKGLIPFGDVAKLADGTLGVCCYNWSPTDGHDSLFYASDDDGRTWQLRGTVRAGDSNETAPLALPDGRLLAAVRTFGDAHLELCESSDHGATWAPFGPVTFGRQHPAHLLLLADGRVLLTVGLRNEGLWGVGARLSDDGGRTWSPPRVLVDFETATDGGYPSSVETEDGGIVTAYYCNRTPAHQRYHMGVLRWSLKERK
jgi:hypothetical protein